MDVFQLATRLVTTGEDQTAEALKRVEVIGTSAADNITAAWSGVTFDPATRSAGAFADVSGNLAAQIRLATSAADQQIQSVENLGGALNAIDAGQLKAVEQEMVALQARITALQSVPLPEGKISGFASVAVAELGVLQRQLAQTRAGFVQMGGTLPQAGQAMAGASAQSTKLASILGKVPKALSGIASAAVGIPGPIGHVGAALLQLGAGGAVVAAVALGMTLIGGAMQKAREKAEAESQRISQTVQTWLDKLDELTGRAKRMEIEALTKNVEEMTAALEAARMTQRTTTQGASPANPLVARRAEEVRQAEEDLKRAQDALQLAQGHGAGIEAENEKKRKQAIDEARTAYEQYLQTLVRGASLDQTRQASLAALSAEEAKLAGQLEAGNLPLADRVRIAGQLLQVQTALGDLPETEEQRAEAVAKVRAAYEDYLGTLQRAVAFEDTRPAAMNELAAAIGRTTVALRATNLTLEERVRLEERLAALRSAYNEGQTANREKTLNARLKIDLTSLNTGLAADLAIIEANTNAMLEQMGIRLSQAAMDAWDQVREEMLSAPADLMTGIVEGLASGLTQRNAKAGDMILASLGSIFSRMGAAMIKAGFTLTGLWKAIASFGPQSGPALIAAGVVLAGLGKALGASAASSGGGGASSGGASGPSFDGYRGNDERVVRIVVMPPAGQTAAQDLTPVAPVTFNIFGPNDPLAQRAVADAYNAAKARGLTK